MYQCTFVFKFPCTISWCDYLLMLDYRLIKAKRYIHEGFLVWIIRSTYHVLQGWWLGIKQCFTPYFEIYIYIYICICYTYWIYTTHHLLAHCWSSMLTCFMSIWLYDYPRTCLYIWTITGLNTSCLYNLLSYSSLYCYTQWNSLMNNSSWDLVNEHV